MTFFKLRRHACNAKKNAKTQIEKTTLENDDKILDAIITYPKILERPIIIYKEKAIIARPAELLYDFL